MLKLILIAPPMQALNKLVLAIGWNTYNLRTFEALRVFLMGSGRRVAYVKQAMPQRLPFPSAGAGAAAEAEAEAQFNCSTKYLDTD